MSNCIWIFSGWVTKNNDNVDGLVKHLYVFFFTLTSCCYRLASVKQKLETLKEILFSYIRLMLKGYHNLTEMSH